MKKNIIFYFLLFFFFSGYFYSYSEECKQRIVCLNSMGIIEKIPEFQKIQKELDKSTKIHENVLDKLTKEFHKKVEKFQKNKNPILKKKLEILQEKIHAYQKTASEDLTKKQNELLNPIYKKIEKAIRKVVENDKNIIRVDDCTPGKGVLFNRGRDITKEVKKELGIY